jgi:hypothetical protein
MRKFLFVSVVASLLCGAAQAGIVCSIQDTVGNQLTYVSARTWITQWSRRLSRKMAGWSFRRSAIDQFGPSLPQGVGFFPS